eukprot:TRINITY_DN1301_c0_g3_i7.p1 TRINITY_DN1301_c0_g3~~TRINITY_DN1301_c0_g3_i7.p1  ORF type:complete len:106 (+),score=8.23 TRINITY_DN1301_c0_g3_i7:469-786(+)
MSFLCESAVYFLLNITTISRRPVFYGIKYHRLAKKKAYGLGRGSPKKLRGSKLYLKSINVWGTIEELNDNIRLSGLTHMTILEFQVISRSLDRWIFLFISNFKIF